jgi:hypothetical protein
MPKLVIAVSVAMLSMLAFTGRAHANAGGTGYICSVQFNPEAIAYGNFGFITFTLFSKPSCSGDYIGLNTYCSIGAVDQACSSIVYDEAQLISLYDNLRGAAANNQRLMIFINQSRPNAANPPFISATGSP